MENLYLIIPPSALRTSSQLGVCEGEEAHRGGELMSFSCWPALVTVSVLFTTFSSTLIRIH